MGQYQGWLVPAVNNASCCWGVVQGLLGFSVSLLAVFSYFSMLQKRWMRVQALVNASVLVA